MKFKVITVALLAAVSLCMVSCSEAETIEPKDDGYTIYLEAGAENGNGTKTEPYGDVVSAIEKAKELGASGAEHIILNFGAGDYSLTEPLALTGEAFGNATLELICEDKEMAVIGAWLPVTGFTETEVNGVKAWVAYMPQLNGETVYSHQFFNSDHERLERPRYPETGYLENEYVTNANLDKVPCSDVEYKGGDRISAFYFYEGDIPEDITKTEDVQMCMFHYWNDERLAVSNIDHENNLMYFSASTNMNFREHDGSGGRYYLDNVFEYLNSPGEVYNDRESGKLYYIPAETDKIEDFKIFVSTVDTMLTVNGMNGTEEKAALVVKNIGFEGSDWKNVSRWAGQAAQDIPAAVQLSNSSYITFENCSFDHIGNYAVEIQTYVNNVTFDHCSVSDIGGGGFRISGANVVPVTDEVPHDIVITDCSVNDYGNVHRNAIGIHLKYAYDCTISHNEISDGFYTGISVGWMWGYSEHATHNILVEKNHVYNIGQGLLTDMGGIYTLGVQPGTVIRGNLVHDITDNEKGYGVSAFYTDEGSSNMIIEKNIGYNTTGQIYSHHYGIDNIIRNNIFAFGRLGGVNSNTSEERVSFSFERNIVINDFGPIYHIDEYKDDTWVDDSNLLWDYTLKEQVISWPGTIDDSDEKWLEIQKKLNRRTVEENGLYKNAVFADPLFADALNYDFTLDENSPAFDIGFEPIDTSDIGPRN